ncbi:MAG: hypothetical protein NDJ90_04785 [Oligoflexia bacterium]|nr:hypothetical protein [Oligoflexia bacterium]
MAKRLLEPSAKFQVSPRKREKYRNVSYRIREDVLKRLSQYVDKDQSASFLVGKMIEWALDSQDGKK